VAKAAFSILKKAITAFSDLAVCNLLFALNCPPAHYFIAKSAKNEAQNPLIYIKLSTRVVECGKRWD
jgi:hypothetical protein